MVPRQRGGTRERESGREGKREGGRCGQVGASGPAHGAEAGR
jgi:hypothetical protein